MSSESGPKCFQVEGLIEGKFDGGYLVSVKMGSEVLKGVIYHQQDQQAPSSSSKLATQTCNATVLPCDPPPHRYSGRMNRMRKNRNPSRVEPKWSGYNFFFAEKHSILKSRCPKRKSEFTKMIVESWKNLSPEEKKVYQNYGVKDKERYQKEKATEGSIKKE